MMKKCPRCGQKVLFNERKCPDCGLLYERLEYVSNKAGKKNIVAGKKDEVIYVSKLPDDVPFWKLLLIALIGFTGSHCLYVGKYKRGFITLAVFLLSMVGIIIPILTEQWFYEIFVIIPLGIFVFVWLYDLILICIKKFKVPVSVDKSVVMDVDSAKKAMERNIKRFR